MTARKVSQLSSVRLWGTTWQVWSAAQGDLTHWSGPTECAIETCTVTEPAILAVPCRLCPAVPLWLPGTDASLFSEMAQLELEVRGLLGKHSTGDSFALLPVTTVGDRTLVVAVVFPVELPEVLCHSSFVEYEPSPLVLGLPADSCVLWQEGDDLVTAVTRGNDVVYWETADAPMEPLEVQAWLECILLQLQAEGILEQSPRLVSFLPDLQALPDSILGVSLEPQRVRPEGGAPEVTRVRLRWKPPHCQAAEQAAQKRARRKQIVLALAASYLLFVAMVGGWFGWLSYRAYGLGQQVRSQADRVSAVQEAAREWALISATIDSPTFPLELLHRVVSKMPADGLRFTNFEVKEGVVQVQGEARTITMASRFANELEKSPELKAISWEMPTPIVLPNNAAQFNITGTLSHENPQS